MNTLNMLGNESHKNAMTFNSHIFGAKNRQTFIDFIFFILSYTLKINIYTMSIA